MSDSVEEELATFFPEVFEQCIERGMRLPFIMCAVAKNHSVTVARVNWATEFKDTDSVVLAEHIEGDRFTLPVSIMIVSHDGEVARVDLVVDNTKRGVKTTFH